MSGLLWGMCIGQGCIALLNVAMIGRPREPITHGQAVVSLIASGLLIVAYLHLGGVL